MQAEMRQGHDVDAEHRHLPLVAGLRRDVGSHRVWSKGGMAQSSASHAPRLLLLSEICNRRTAWFLPGPQRAATLAVRLA